jgi:hypothetical protein
LAVSGARHFEKKRGDGSQWWAVNFFCKIWQADCGRVVIENPVNIISGGYVEKWFPDLAKKYKLPIKPTQIVHPWWFGDELSKSTCLWERGVPPLVKTNVVGKGEFIETGKNKKRYASWLAWAKDESGKTIAWNDPRTALIRAKTQPGLARAMADQWGCDICPSPEQLTLF